MNTANSYTRMFPRLERFPSTPNSKLEDGLAELGLAMKDDGLVGDGAVGGGVTYLGQFIDHDLTLDLTPLDYAQPNADRTPNFRTPFLDLDHVYGEGPNLSPFLYEMKGPPGTERFLIGLTRKSKVGDQHFQPSLNDLPRNANGIALVGDPRQDENLIIAQLHVAFLKLHNRLMNELASGNVESVGPVGASLFEQARRLVIWHYQYIALNDFLRALIAQPVFDEIRKGCALWARTRQTSFCIPIEFSLAAFRFGHSMVRDSYPYNKTHSDAQLGELLKQTGIAGGAVPRLPADWVIEWDRFFSLGGFPRLARRIDTMIARGLHDLQMHTVQLYRAPRSNQSPSVVEPRNSLPVRTLWRGARTGLPSGQDISKALCIEKPLTESEISGGPHEAILTKHDFHKDTPLWYYVLKEAESVAGGAHLGPVGSHLVANVILGALIADPNSFLSINPNWLPTLRGQSITRISDLLAFILSS